MGCLRRGPCAQVPVQGRLCRSACAWGASGNPHSSTKWEEWEPPILPQSGKNRNRLAQNIFLDSQPPGVKRDFFHNAAPARICGSRIYYIRIDWTGFVIRPFRTRYVVKQVNFTSPVLCALVNKSETQEELQWIAAETPLLALTIPGYGKVVYNRFIISSLRKIMNPTLPAQNITWNRAQA